MADRHPQTDRDPDVARDTGFAARQPGDDIAHLTGELYQSAPAAERRRLLEHLLRPLGLLAMLGVANGVFAKIWFRRDWQDLRIRIEDTQLVGTDDVAALVHFVQQVSIDTIESMARLVADSPVMAASAITSVLVTLCLHREPPVRSGTEPAAADPSPCGKQRP